jgi:hypothetical protein
VYSIFISKLAAQIERKIERRVNKMPTQFTITTTRWLCNECPQLCDTEPACVVHERETHKPPVAIAKEPSVTQALQLICARIHQEKDISLLLEYERMCNTLVAKVQQANASP